MKSISESDKNFALNDVKIIGDTVVYDIGAEPFTLHGMTKTENGFIRMDENIAAAVSEGVKEFNRCPACGRVRFVTDSPYITLYVDGPEYEKDAGCMCVNGKAGFSLYETTANGQRLINVFGAARESTFEFNSKATRELTVYFPIYYAPYDVRVGLGQGAFVGKARPYTVQKPVVFYGSSITQGATASHPGNPYIAMLSRKYDFDFINLGFSGNCKGEPLMAEYISQLDMSAFVLDYDHNAPSVEYHEKTFYPFYETVRKANPYLPIIMMTMPYGRFMINGWSEDRRKVIENAYEKGIRNGDKNLYYVNQNHSFDRFGGQDGTSDLIHPNDLGFACMADAMTPVFDKIFGK